MIPVKIQSLLFGGEVHPPFVMPWILVPPKLTRGRDACSCKKTKLTRGRDACSCKKQTFGWLIGWMVGWLGATYESRAGLRQTFHN